MGLKFVQFQKNSSLHSGIQRSPYNALFGCEPRIGLRSLKLPDEVVARMLSEEDLLNVLQTSSDVIDSNTGQYTCD